MARSQRTSNPVTLFPFLAVLLCTIGALVLMLVVVSAGIRKDAVATAKHKSEADAVARREPQPIVADAEPPAPLPAISDDPAARLKPIDPEFAPDPPPSPIEEASPRTLSEIARLENLKLKLKHEIADRSQQVDNVSAKTEALTQQLRMVKAKQNDLQQAIIRRANQRAELNEVSSELRVENRQILELLDESRKLINEHKKQVLSPVHSIVPYDGQTGTVRRAIIIECVDDVVRFEAEQVEIPIELLQKFSPAQNPLASGVQALFSYWMAKEQLADPGRRPEKPYALILVRPSGAEAFSSAVFALDEMIGDFGYELVEDEFKYEVPETTPDAVRECRAAVESELRRGPIRSRRVLSPQGPLDISRVARGPAASRSFFSSDDFRNRRSSDAGNGEEGTSTGGIVSGNSLSDGDLAGNRNGSASGNRQSAQRLPDGSPPGGLSDSFLQGLADRRNSLLEKGPPSRFDAARAAALAEALKSGSLETGGEHSGRSIGQRDRPGEMNREAINDGGNGAFNPQIGKNSGSPAGRDVTANRPESSGGGARQNSTNPPRWLADTSGRPASGSSGQQSGTDRSSGGSAGRGSSDRGPTNEGAASRGGQTANSFTENSSKASTSPNGTSRTQSTSGGNPAANQTAGTDQQASQNSSSSTSSTSSSRESSSGSDSSPVSGNGPSIPSLSRSNQLRPLKPQRRWGLSHPDASLGLEKVVVITVETGRVVIGNQYQVTRRPELTTDQITARTILALDEVAKKWGWPPPRFYWVPSVKVNVEPGEEQLGLLVRKALEEAGAGFEK